MTFNTLFPRSVSVESRPRAYCLSKLPTEGELTKEAVLTLLGMPEIYCLERAKKSLLASAIQISAKDLKGVQNVQERLSNMLAMGWLYQDEEVFHLALQLGADPEDVSQLDLTHIHILDSKY
jgi:hypothetical protein